MTSASAIYSFLSGFGIPVYAATSVPDDAGHPYMTYVLATSSFGSDPVDIEVDLWYRGDTEAEANAKAVELSKALPKVIACDGGGIVLQRGSTFCQSMSDPDDDKIKRRYIMLSADFITNF